VADVGERWPALLESVLVSPRISTRRARTPRTGAASDSGSGMGAEIFRQVRSDTVYEADRGSVTCADACKQALCTPARPVRDEEHPGSASANTYHRSNDLRPDHSRWGALKDFDGRFYVAVSYCRSYEMPRPCGIQVGDLTNYFVCEFHCSDVEQFAKPVLGGGQVRLKHEPDYFSSLIWILCDHMVQKHGRTGPICIFSYQQDDKAWHL
jgi:hypothetical protein